MSFLSTRVVDINCHIMLQPLLAWLPDARQIQLRLNPLFHKVALSTRTYLLHCVSAYALVTYAMKERISSSSYSTEVSVVFVVRVNHGTELLRPTPSHL